MKLSPGTNIKEIRNEQSGRLKLLQNEVPGYKSQRIARSLRVNSPFEAWNAALGWICDLIETPSTIGDTDVVISSGTSCLTELRVQMT